MKRLFILAVLAMGSLVATAQKPYASAGASVSSNVVTGSAEFGVYDDNNWYAVTGETYEVGNGMEYYVGVKYYRKAFNAGKTAAVYGFAAAKVHVDKYKDLVFEPGLCLVQNIGKKFAIQASISSPIYENSDLFKPTWLSSGLSLNWWIK